ncbi:MAG: hypothetical protein ACE5HA_09425, partial [Anaerolineae bacterium]
MDARRGPLRATSGRGSWLWSLLGTTFACLLILTSTSARPVLSEDCPEPCRRVEGLSAGVALTEAQLAHGPAAPSGSDSSLGQPTPEAKKTPAVPPEAGPPGAGRPTITGSDAAGQPARFQLPTNLRPAAIGEAGALLQPFGGAQDGVTPQDWEADFTEGFEGDFPGTVWQLFDGSDDGFERTWGLDDSRVKGGSASAWVAAGGADALDPEFSFYPHNLDSWMTIGPIDLRNAQAADVEFQMWRDTEPQFDYVFAGASTDG